MSAGKCARCEQTVYPVEGLRCLDKIWHKGCFKCQECSMTLNLKNYKGFDKKPYCNAHCPQAKATTVADTPESRRLAENTRIQSQAKYHEDFEKSKGKNFTTIADDPEIVRIKNTSKIISNVSYHGDLERKKQMEEKRGTSGPDEAALVNAMNNNNSSHHQNRMHQQHHNNIPSPHHQHNHPHQRQQEPPTSNYATQQLQIQNDHGHHHQQQQHKLQKQLLEQQQSQLAHQQQALKYNLLKQQHQQVLYSQDHTAGVGQPVINRQHDARQPLLPPQFSNQHANPHQQQYPQNNGGLNQQQQQQLMISRQHQAMMHQQQRHPPLDMNRLSGGQVPMVTSARVPNTQQQMIKIPMQHQQSPKYGGPPMNELIGHHHQPSPNHLVAGAKMTHPAAGMIGNPKIASYNVNGPQAPQPLIGAYNQRPPLMAAMVNGAVPKQQQHYAMQPHIIRHVVQPGQPQHPASQQHPHQQQQMMQRNQHIQHLPPHYQHQQPPIPVRAYRAVYDYEANDIDEVTFFENDVLINCIDAGGNWLIGKVARTGQEGMFPANYVTEYLNHP